MSEIDTSSEEFQAALDAALEEKAGALKSALDKERDARKEAERSAAKYKDIDPEKYRELMAKAEKAEEEKAREEGKFEELLEKNGKKWEGIVSDLKSKNEALTTSLESTLIESAAKTAISQYGGDAELLLPHVTMAAKLIENGGRHVAVVVDEKGEPRLAPEAKTASDYMGIDQLVGSWKDAGKYPGAFAGTGSSGGGANNNNSPNRGGPQKTVGVDDILSNIEGVAKGEVKVAID